MRFSTALLVLSFSAIVQAQTDSPEVSRARVELERIRGLVQSGAAAPAQLQAAEQDLQDLQDAALLRNTLYGAVDLTQEQSAEMVAAASRRVQRRQDALAKAEKLVKLGAAAKNTVATSQEDLDSARKEMELAEGRARLVQQIAEAAEAEERLATLLARSPAEGSAVAEKFEGNGVFGAVQIERVETAFEHRFGKPLPVSARGETAVHRAMGFDHRGRLDVALQPDTAEGAWLRQYLIEQHIPYFAFRQAVPGKATGAHIHIGPASTRIANGG